MLIMGGASLILIDPQTNYLLSSKTSRLRSFALNIQWLYAQLYPDIFVLSGKYKGRSVFAVEMCGLIPHNIVQE
jgi:hypothetical protein